MPRLVRQNLPDPPATYDQAYLSKLVNAINLYMFQATALAEVIAGRFICTDPVIVDPTSNPIPGSVPSTAGLPVGTFYLYKEPGGAQPGQPGYYYVSIVTEQDQ